MGFIDKRPNTGGRPGPPAAKRPAGVGGSAGPHHGGYAPGKGPPAAAPQAMDEDEADALAAMQNDDVDDGPPPPDDGDGDDDEAAGGQLEDVAVHLGEAGRNWERPKPAPLDCATQDLSEWRARIGKSRSSSFHFRSTAILMPSSLSLSHPLLSSSAFYSSTLSLSQPSSRSRSTTPSYPRTSASAPDATSQRLPCSACSASTPTARRSRRSFTASTPYFYVEAPPNFGPDDCEGLCRSLNVS